MRLLGSVALLVGCGTSAPTSFIYDARFWWDATRAPEVVSLWVDGVPMVSGDVYERTFASLDEATQATAPIIIVTTTGTLSTTLVPSWCGGQAPSCLVTRERDDWEFFRAGNGALILDSGAGQCSCGDRPATGWIY